LQDNRIVPARHATFSKYDLLRRDDQIEDRRDRNAKRIYARLIQTVTDRIDPEGFVISDLNEPEFLCEGDGDSGSDYTGLWHPIEVTEQQTPEVIKRILDFSDEFGLLGIVHRMYVRIVGPVVSSPGVRMRVYCQRGGHHDWEPTEGWGRTFLCGPDKLIDRYSLCISAADRHSDLTFEELNAEYFAGGLPEHIPHPNSEEFFTHYSEPLVDWINEAVTLARAIQERDGDQLSEVLRPSWTEYTLGSSLATAKFCAGSLLEAAAFQFLEDYNAGFELRYCCNTTCPRRLYYDNDPRSGFCSQRCASTQRQREHREKEKLKLQRRRVQARKGARSETSK
jgi:hypothetical protein